MLDFRPPLGEFRPTMLHVLQPLSAHNPPQRLSFSHDRAPMRMPHIAARWRALRPATKPHLATAHEIQQLTCALLSTMLARSYPLAHALMPCPLACCCTSRPRAHSAQSCELLPTPPTYAVVRVAQHCLRPCRSVHSIAAP